MVFPKNSVIGGRKSKRRSATKKSCTSCQMPFFKGGCGCSGKMFGGGGSRRRTRGKAPRRRKTKKHRRRQRGGWTLGPTDGGVQSYPPFAGAVGSAGDPLDPSTQISERLSGGSSLSHLGMNQESVQQYAGMNPNNLKQW